MSIDQIAKTLISNEQLTRRTAQNMGSPEVQWEPELEKGQLAEKKVRSALESKGYEVTHFVMKDNAKAADIKFLNKNGEELIGEIKYLAGVDKDGKALPTLVFEVLTAAKMVSHSLREDFIKVYFFYNDYENKIFIFEGEQFRKLANKLKEDGKTVSLWDNNTHTHCTGVKMSWTEIKAGYIGSWSVA